MVNRLILLASLLATAVLIVIMTFFAPMDLGPLGVLLFFTTFYVVLFGICTLFVRIFVKVSGGKAMGRKQYLYAAVIALGPLMLLMVQSFGSFNPWTTALTAIFVVLACFTVNKVA